MPHSKKTTVQQTNDRNMTERKVNASAKSKLGATQRTSRHTVAPHLLFVKPHHDNIYNSIKC